MAIDFEIRRPSRRCEATGRDLAPGEAFYSVLVPEGDDVARHDYCVASWQGAPEGALGWWKTRVPGGEGKPTKAPNEVLLNLFDLWADDPAEADARYVLALLLVRRRVLRSVAPPLLAEADAEDGPPGETLRLYCPTRDETYETPIAAPDDERSAEIQRRLDELLGADPVAAAPSEPTGQPKGST